MDKEKQIIIVIQVILAISFLVGFTQLMLQILKTLKFSVKELLNPILKVSEQMIIMS